MKRLSMFTILLALIFPLTFFVSTGHTNTFTDSFDTGINSFYWTTNLENPLSSVTWDAGNQRVLMTQGAGNGSGDSRGANLVFNFPITGDFEVKVDYTLVTWPTNNLERSGMRTTFGAIERISDTRFGGETYLTDYNANINYTATTDGSGTLRFLRTGSTLNGYYWNTTLTIPDWTLIATDPYSASGTMNVLELSIWPWTATQGVQVAFDNFYLNSDTVIPTPGVPEPATMLLLGSGLIGLAGYGRKKFFKK